MVFAPSTHPSLVGLDPAYLSEEEEEDRINNNYVTMDHVEDEQVQIILRLFYYSVSLEIRALKHSVAWAR